MSELVALAASAVGPAAVLFVFLKWVVEPRFHKSIQAAVEPITAPIVNELGNIKQQSEEQFEEIERRIDEQRSDMTDRWDAHNNLHIDLSRQVGELEGRIAQQGH